MSESPIGTDGFNGSMMSLAFGADPRICPTQVDPDRGAETTNIGLPTVPNAVFTVNRFSGSRMFD